MFVRRMCIKSLGPLRDNNGSTLPFRENPVKTKFSAVSRSSNSSLCCHPSEPGASLIWVIRGAAEPGLPASSRISVDVRTDHNLAFARVEEPGSDLTELVGQRLRELCLHRVDCVYVDLPLSHPATARAGLEGWGLFFGGITLQAHPAGGDILRLQYLNNVEIERGDVSTASDFGRELLDLIFDQRESRS